jgi:hypothetical protein
MLPNSIIHEKLALEHRQQLLREAERGHLLAQGGQRHHDRISYLLRRIGKLFVARRSSMKPVEQISEVFAACAEEPVRDRELQEVRG